jgi:hypothetical protein
MNKSLYIWHYYLVIPAAAVTAADVVSPALNNPDGIESTFQAYPEDEEIPTHWIGSFVATENTLGTPSKAALESALNTNSELSNIFWIRSKNEHHPDTLPEEKGKVIATNWADFAVST